jgi:hypothetical protein
MDEAKTPVISREAAKIGRRTASLERRLRAEQNEFFLDAGATNLEN